MTNLAVALVLERRLVTKIPRIVAMAAEFRQPFAEWNIRCDPEAAHVVLSSGMPIDLNKRRCHGRSILASAVPSLGQVESS